MKKNYAKIYNKYAKIYYKMVKKNTHNGEVDFDGLNRDIDLYSLGDPEFAAIYGRKQKDNKADQQTETSTKDSNSQIDTGKKYVLTDTTKKVNGRTLYQIKATRDIYSLGDKIANKGELGGFIESEFNLSQDGDCWIGQNTFVYGNAQVSENARIGLSSGGIIKKNGIQIGYNCGQVNKQINKNGSSIINGSIIGSGNFVVGHWGNKGHNKTIINRGGTITITDDGVVVKGDTSVIESSQSDGPESSIYGNAKVRGNCKICGAAEIYEYAVVEGDATLTGNVEAYGNAVIDGQAHISGNVEAYGNSHIGEYAHISGNAEVSGNAQIMGRAHISGNVDLSGNAKLAGNTHLSGNLELGDDEWE